MLMLPTPTAIYHDKYSWIIDFGTWEEDSMVYAEVDKLTGKVYFTSPIPRKD